MNTSVIDTTDGKAVTKKVGIDRILRSAAGRLLRLSRRVEQFAIRRRVVSVAGRHAIAIPSYTQPQELCALFKLVTDSVTEHSVLEIGSHLGASACYLAAGLLGSNRRLFCIDTWQNDAMPEGVVDTYAQFLSNIRQLSDVVTPIRKRSEDVCPDDVALPLGLAFIDGDHSFEAARTDFLMFSTWVVPGGIVAFHDASKRFPGVTRVIGEALSQGGWLIEGRVHSLVWLRKR